ncbi:MAG: RecX family transcriptional regulator [Oscillospiraceae bacterium]|nr:RecX family transcriptional regulator [Oscillospiraceae bacterium]
MMRLDSIAAQPDRVGRHRAVFSDGTVLRLYRQTVQDFALYEGRELTGEEYEQLQLAHREMSAKMRAVRIVSASSVSKKDLEQRLIQKGEHPDSAKNAVSWLLEMELVDDRQTAQQVVSRCIAKGYGVARAKQVLYEKRIPKEYWEEALADYPDQVEFIQNYVENHLPEQANVKEMKKVIDALLRKGHSYGMIRRVMDLQDALEDE